MIAKRKVKMTDLERFESIAEASGLKYTEDIEKTVEMISDERMAFKTFIVRRVPGGKTFVFNEGGDYEPTYCPLPLNIKIGGL